MRWIKHLTDSSDDEFIQALEACFGWEGYGRWWKLCEAIGRRMKPGQHRASLNLPVATWCGILKAKRKQLEIFLGYLTDHGKISRQQTGDILEIELPNLLKYRDEYARKSGHARQVAPEKVRDKSTENREQKKKGTRLSDEWQPGQTTREWAAAKYPRVRFDAEVEKFRDWHIGKGSTWVDWDRSLMTWIRRAAEDLKPATATPTRSKAPSPLVASLMANES